MEETTGAVIRKALSQEEISREIPGISESRLKILLHDEEKPTLSEVVKLSKSLNIPLEKLLRKDFYPESYIPSEKSAKRILNLQASRKGDKINLNLPLSTVRLFITSGKLESYIEGSHHVKNINWDELLILLDAGTVGTLADFKSENLDIKITLK